MKFTSLLSVQSKTDVPMLDAETPSFMGLPIAKTKEDLTGADIAIIGVPYDTPPSTGRDPDSWKDFHLAPRATRINSMRYGGYLPEYDLNVLQHLRIVDYGDAAICRRRHPKHTQRHGEGRGRSSRRLITLGGFSPSSMRWRAHLSRNGGQGRYHEPRRSRRL